MAVFLTQSLCKTYMNYSRMTVEPFAEKDPPSHHQVVLPCNIIICRFQKRSLKKKRKGKKEENSKEKKGHNQVVLPCNIIICRFQKKVFKKEEKREKRGK